MIDIIIEGRNVKFDPISVEWIMKRDYFAFATLDGTKCFIKKYEGKKPTAWELMISMIGQGDTNMPMVYDAVFDKVSNTYFVFIEFIRGITLKEYILKGDMVLPLKVMEDIDTALSVLHSKGFWFSDFNEENIFITSGFIKKVLLIDIDSCWKSSIPPNHISNEIGGIPGAAQNIGRHVLEFYSKYLSDTTNTVMYKDLPGANFNYLQLLVLCVKLNIFQNRKRIDATFQYIRPDSFRDLQKIIHDCDANYSKGVFTLSKDANRNVREPVKQLINRIINRNN
jgi:serine/threonine protein kinase